MKKIKSYTGIWNVAKVLYAINDFNLPFHVTITQITWFVITEFIIILFGDIPPLSMIEGAFLKYFGIPAVSYTHLDVYKRQVFLFKGQSENGCPFLFEELTKGAERT